MRVIDAKHGRSRFLVITGFFLFVFPLFAQEDPLSIDQLCREYRKAGRTEEAFSLYQQGLQTPAGANSVPLRQGMIEMLIEKGEFGQAQEQIEILFTDYSNQTDEFTRSIYPILNRYLYRKDYIRVVELGRRALQLYPEHGNAFSTRTVMAEALVRMDQTAEADALVEEMFALYRGREDFVPLMHTVKSAYWKAGQKDKSQVLCRRLLAEFPKHPLATRLWGDWICGAMILEQEEGLEEAIDTLFSRPEPAADFLAVVARIQERYLARNDFSGALALGNRALQVYPERAEAIGVYRYLAQASAGLGDAEQASIWSDALMTRFGDHPDIAGVLIETGHAFRRYGLYIKATEVYREVLLKNCARKDHLCALTGMAQSYIHLGEDARVNEIVEQIVRDYRQEEKCGYSVFVIGEEYFIRAEQVLQTGHQTEAEENYQRAERVWEINRNRIPEDPKHQAMATHFTGWTYQQRGDCEKAVELYEKVLEEWPSYEKTWQCALVACDCYEKLTIAGILSRQEANKFIKKCYERILKNPQSCPAPIKQHIRIWIERFEKEESPSLNDKRLFCYGIFL